MSKSSSVLEVDARVELVSALEAVTAGAACSCEPSEYLARVRAALPAGDEACRLFAAMRPEDWRHKHPSLILLDFTAPPALAVEAHREHYEGTGRDDALARLLPPLRRFAAERFMPFLESERGFYEALRRAAAPGFEDLDFVTPVEEYVGPVAAHRYHVVLAPLLHGGNMHNLLYRRPDGVYDIYSITGHHGVEGGRPQLEAGSADLAYQGWHEVLHTLVDSLTQRHREALEPLSPLYALMTATARNRYRGPQGWLHMVDEHVIRALTARIGARVYGAEFGAQRLAHEKAEGFALVGLVHEVLGEYEADRGRYPTLARFYPRLVEALQKLGAALPGAKGGRRA